MAWTNDDQNDNKSTFEAPKPGVYWACCYSVIDLGRRLRQGYKGGEPKIQPRAMISFELPWNYTKEGKPMTMSAFYTVTFYERAPLYKHLSSWAGHALTPEETKSFDPRVLLGQWAQIVVGLSTTGKSVIDNILSPGDALANTQLPPLVNPLVYFSVYEWDQATYEKLSPGIRRMVDESEERKAFFAQQLQAPVVAPPMAAPPMAAPPMAAPPMAAPPMGGFQPPVAQPVTAPPMAAPPMAAPPTMGGFQPPAAPRVATPQPFAPTHQPAAQAVVEDDIPF